jgi:hypothetical protein
MAIAAEELKVLEAVVRPIAVDVMQLHVERISSPFCDPAFLTVIFLHSGVEQTVLQVAATRLLPASHQESLDWHLPSTPLYSPSLNSLGPTCLRETEFVAALSYGESGIISTLNLIPVVPNCEVVSSGDAKSPRVICHGGLCHPEFTTDLGVGHPFCEALTNQGALL